jgi:hypothetical protein
VLAHRMVVDPQARFAGLNAKTIVTDILQDVQVPA